MKGRKPKSFNEVTFSEAIARRVRVDMALPATDGGEDDVQVVSQFLGIDGPGRLAMATPETLIGKKVFVSEGTGVNISFGLEDVCFRADTRVIEHSMFRRTRTRRVDALIVQQPDKLVMTNRRRHPRYRVDQSKVFLVTIWAGEDVSDIDAQPEGLAGRIQDWSQEGLGIMLEGRPAGEPGKKFILALDFTNRQERLFLWGVLRHCTAVDGGAWRAGFGDVTGVRAGEAVNLMELLANSPSR